MTHLWPWRQSSTARRPPRVKSVPSLPTTRSALTRHRRVIPDCDRFPSTLFEGSECPTSTEPVVAHRTQVPKEGGPRRTRTRSGYPDVSHNPSHNLGRTARTAGYGVDEEPLQGRPALTQTDSKDGRERSAKPCTAVRFRSPPQDESPAQRPCSLSNASPEPASIPRESHTPFRFRPDLAASRARIRSPPNRSMAPDLVLQDRRPPRPVSTSNGTDGHGVD
jgi:hypothetical protein